MHSREVIARLLREGWRLRNVSGSHQQFTQPGGPGRITVQHPRDDIPIGTLRSIYRQAGWDWKER